MRCVLQLPSLASVQRSASWNFIGSTTFGHKIIETSLRRPLAILNWKKNETSNRNRMLFFALLTISNRREVTSVECLEGHAVANELDIQLWASKVRSESFFHITFICNGCNPNNSPSEFHIILKLSGLMYYMEMVMFANRFLPTENEFSRIHGHTNARPMKAHIF